MILIYQPFKVIWSAICWATFFGVLAKLTYHAGHLGPFVLSVLCALAAAFIGLRMMGRTMATMWRAFVR